MSILENQIVDCPGCGEPVTFTVARGQWILARPAAMVAGWPALDAKAQGIFERVGFDRKGSPGRSCSGARSSTDRRLA